MADTGVAGGGHPAFARMVPSAADRLFVARGAAFGALPDNTGIAFERRQRTAGVGPLLQFVDMCMVQRMAAGTSFEQRARDVHHASGPLLVPQWRSAALAECADRTG